MVSHTEYRDERRCSACGGRCCTIYLPEEDGGAFPSGLYWFDKWVEGWRKAFRESGALESAVEPLFDPLLAHMPGQT
ncbi:hypothetical protein V3F56_06230 [Moorellaceae bacterium AZ2]